MARARSGGGGNGAIIGLVVFGAGFLVCLILAILFYTRVETAEQDAENARSELAEVINGADRNEALDAAIDEMDGSTTVAKLLNRVSESRLEIDRLLGQVIDVSGARDLAQAEVNQSKASIELARADLQHARDSRGSIERDLRREVDSLSATISAISSENDKLKSLIDQSILDITENYERQIEQQNTQLGGLNEQISGFERQVSDLNLTIVKIRGVRPEAVALTDPDATVVSQIPDQNKVYLNIGRDKNLKKGIAFSVYDPDKIVRLEGEQPRDAKAIVEIINVDESTAVGLVVRRRPRAVVNDGDALVNLVFDPNRVFTFHVFGQFDIDADGDIDDNGVEAIKSLVARANGQFSEDIGFATVYVVLGVAPKLPQQPEDEFDLPKMRIYRVELENYQAYQDRINQARELGIPVLNQNRFLDLVGFFRR